MPPGQYVTGKFPVLTYGPTLETDLNEWRFPVFGLVGQEVALNGEEFIALPQMAVTRDFYAEPKPAVAMRGPGRLWHWGKVLFEKRWLRGWA